MTSSPLIQLATTPRAVPRTPITTTLRHPATQGEGGEPEGDAGENGKDLVHGNLLGRTTFDRDEVKGDGPAIVGVHDEEAALVARVHVVPVQLAAWPEL